MTTSTPSATHNWTVPVVPLGNVSAGVVVWRRGGLLHISPVVKATFALVKGGPMTPAAPVPLRTAEQLHDDAPDSSIRASVDTAPQLQHADVIFWGHAHAPAGVESPRVSVRLLVKTAAGVELVDKRLEVLGDRLLIPGRPPPDPTPFKTMPIVYERTYGGPDHGPNPVGLGQLAELGGRRRLPNIVHPPRSPHAAVEPAGFGPISMQWPARRRMLRATPHSVLERPIVEIPDDLDLSYFQAAPADQQITFLQQSTPPEKRIDYFHGDEWIVLEGLHKLHGVLETQLPGARGVAKVYLPGGLTRPVTLVADTLFIDGDAERCSITWRGSFSIPSTADLPATSVAVAVEMPGQTVNWPDRLPDRFPAVQPGAPPPLGLPPLPGPPMPYAPPPLPGPPMPYAPPPLPGAVPAPAFGRPPPGPPAPAFGPPPPAPRAAPVIMAAPIGARPAPPAPAKPAAQPAPKAAPGGDEDGGWGLGTVVMQEPDPEPVAAPPHGRAGPPAPRAAGAPPPPREKGTVIMEVSALVPGPRPLSSVPPPPAPPGPPRLPTVPPPKKP